ncbi:MULTISPECIES: FimV family protein [Halomonadaceae]|uniref:type IV pilus assembly protein FimV n=1 Tax=Halomonadaceae TaxID=28256 RepID=UPI00159B239E|nr:MULTISPECIES: FimV/HubP family polar landmark protein [Halomonas]QJQ94032.1 hypothetical protein HIO72_01110 [Halomonas sp. PA5]
MKRKLTLAIMMALWTPATTMALGIGEAVVASTLNAPLRAVLPLSDTQGVDPREVHVSLAETRAYEQAGMIRSLIASGITFSVEAQHGGLAVVMRSERPIREPYLDLLLDIDWQTGRQLRQVTLLFDPPGYEQRPVLVAAGSPRTSQAMVVDPVATAPSAAPRSPLTYREPPNRVEVRSGDTLGELASRLRPDTSISINQMMLALVEANPEVFPTGNVNEMRAGVTLNVPPRERIERRSGAEATIPPGGNGVEAQRSRLTLLSDAELGTLSDPGGLQAANGSRQTTLSDEESRVEQSRADALADEALLAGSLLANANAQETRLLRLENELLASQQQVQRVGEEREALQQRVESLNEELATLRDQLTLLIARSDAAQAESDANAARQLANTPWWETLVRKVSERAMLLGGGVLVILLALWAVVRRRQSRESAPHHVSDSPRIVSRPRVERRQVSREQADDKTAERQLTPLHDVAPQAEVISEVDIFIAYGRFDQARELLETTLAVDPQRHDLRMKLLTVLVEQGDARAARAEAERLRHSSDPQLSAEAERLLASLQDEPEPGAPEAEQTPLDEREPSLPEQGDEAPEPGPGSLALAAYRQDPIAKIIDYRPPTLVPERDGVAASGETPMQPTVEFDVLPRDTAEQWEIEEVAFEPSHLDNKPPAAASPEVAFKR